MAGLATAAGDGAAAEAPAPGPGAVVPLAGFGAAGTGRVSAAHAASAKSSIPIGTTSHRRGGIDHLPASESRGARHLARAAWPPAPAHAFLLSEYAFTCPGRVGRSAGAAIARRA